MRSRLKRILLFGLFAIAVASMAFAVALRWSFERQWTGITDGMTETEVRAALGNPSWRGKIDVKGVDGNSVTRWSYEQGRWTYHVDFDYTGTGGASEVFRRRKDYREWDLHWPSWVPWAPAKAKA
jgi:hypothetical protein